MCRGFVGYFKVGDGQQHLPIDRTDAEVSPNYNVAPTQSLPVIVRYEGQNVLRLKPFIIGCR